MPFKKANLRAFLFAAIINPPIAVITITNNTIAIMLAGFYPETSSSLGAGYETHSLPLSLRTCPSSYLMQFGVLVASEICDVDTGLFPSSQLGKLSHSTYT